MDKLNEARRIINEVDAEMARLFEKRMGAVRAVAEYKAERGLEIFDAAREAEVVRMGKDKVEDPEIGKYYVSFLKNTMTVSKEYQEAILKGMKVAYSGTEGAFAHIATCKLFPTARKIAYGDFGAAYKAVENGECDAVVLPTENSYNGEVGQVTDLISSGSLYINSMYELAVCQDLLVCKGATISDIKTVVSHPQALGQCAEFISKHGFATKEFVNTALAARMVADGDDRSVAAIASGEAAEIFGLEVLERNINSDRSNTTRFAVLSRTENKIEKSKMGVHTVLTFTVRNEAGALAKAINIIGKHGFNMQSIRSRPMKELLWQYYFYVEAEGNINSPEGKEMLEELGKYCDRLKVLGTFTKK